MYDTIHCVHKRGFISGYRTTFVFTKAKTKSEG